MNRAHALDEARRIVDAVGEAVEGGRLASHFLARLRVEHVDVDDLMRALLTAQAASDDRLRGFARRIQKELEREAANAAR